jgi:hypothetical protein
LGPEKLDTTFFQGSRDIELLDDGLDDLGPFFGREITKLVEFGGQRGVLPGFAHD